jgi:hypothetical protein
MTHIALGNIMCVPVPSVEVSDVTSHAGRLHERFELESMNATIGSRTLSSKLCFNKLKTTTVREESHTVHSLRDERKGPGIATF